MKTGLDARFENYMNAVTPGINGETLVAGVSGGADSVCLLLLLQAYAKENNCPVICVHVNHGIRGEEADRDEAYVRRLCESLENVSFSAFHENITDYAKNAGITVEEAGRARRYEIFAEVCMEHGSRRLFVAHNRRDRAETVLFNLFRGSSAAGLGGIRDEASLLNNENITIYRPLMDIDRPEIEAYLKERECGFCTDSTNLSDDYTRNRIRHTIIPEAERINAGAVEHMCAAADDVSELYAYFETEAGKLFGKLYDGENTSLAIKDFGALPGIMQRELAYMLICKAAGRKKDITRKHINAAVGLALGESGKKVNLPYGIILKREYDRLLALKNPEENEVPEEIPLGLRELAEEFEHKGRMLASRVYECVNCSFEVLVYEKKGAMGFDFSDRNRVYFDLERILETEEPVFRKAGEGDWFSPFKDGRKKSISRFFIDEKLESAKRQSLVLFAAGDHVLWIPGYRNDEGFRIDNNTVNIIEVRRKF